MTIHPRISPVSHAVIIPAALDILFITVFFLLIGSNWLANTGLALKSADAITAPGGFADPVVIAIRTDNRILLQGRVLNAQEWAAQLRAFFDGQKKTVLVVAAPEASSQSTYEVISLLSELNQQVVLSVPGKPQETNIQQTPPDDA